MTSRITYAVDVGSTLSRPPGFAWARVESFPGTVTGDSSIDELVKQLNKEFRSGRNVALGFEAPLFVPVPNESGQLSRARPGEGRLAFSAQVGATAALTAILQAAWIMRAIHVEAKDYTLTVDWLKWPPADGARSLFVWEAFVAGACHSPDHVRDAATAASAFAVCEKKLGEHNAVTCDSPLSLIAAAALWAGWKEASSLLNQPTLVLKPGQPYKGAISAL